MSEKIAHQFMGVNVKILKFTELWLEDGGLVISKVKIIKLFVIFLMVCPTCVALLSECVIVFIDSEPDIVHRIQIILAESCVLGAMYMVICFWKNRSQIRDLVDSIGDFVNYSELDIVPVDKKVGFFTAIVVGYSLLGMIIYTLSPLLLIESCEKTKSQYRVDHGIPCGVIVPIRIHVHPENPHMFRLYLAGQVGNGIMAVLVVVNITMMVCGLVEHALFQLKQVRSLMSKLSEGANIEERLGFVVKYHCVVIKFINNINKYFGSQLVLHFTLTSVVISLLGFQILMVNDRKESLMYALHLIGWFIMLYNICYYGQLLIDESIGVASDAYSVPWYNCSIRVQKDIKFIMMRSQKPLSLKAMNLGIMSHPTFLGVISSSYSYFTLLLNVKSS